MKTSLLISSLATLCLVVVFAGSPNHFASKSESAVPIQSMSALSNESTFGETQVQLQIEEKELSQIPVSLPEDFSYLKFNVNAYILEDSNSLSEPEDLPQAEEPDFSYLKFDVQKYTSVNNPVSAEISELPEDETGTTDIPDNNDHSHN